MTVTELIARAAKRLIDADTQLLGVRVCPVTVAPAEVEQLRKELQDRLGKKTLVALSIPGAKTVDAGRFYVSADHSAAERATLWRNEVKVEDGEHLVYVSVRVHGKAGGLQDCLTPLREADLRAEFELWCDEKGSGMPPGFGAALRESRILDRASALSLCEYATAVQRDRRESKWEGAGHHLPLLNLARDTGLRPSTAAARMEENERVVSRAATGERTSNVTTGPTAQLREAFRAEAGDVQERLRRVDLSDYLDSSTGRKKLRTKEKTQRPAKKASSAKPAKKPLKLALDPNAALVDAANSDSKDTLGDLERRAKKLERDANPESARGKATDRVGGAGGEEHPTDPVWSKAQQASEFGALAERVPLGLGAMLLKSLQGEGFGLRWTARESAAALLEDLPAHQAPTEVRWEISDGAVRSALQRVIECRRAAAQLLLADSGLRPLSTFITSPLVALADRVVRAAMVALLDASAALFAAVAKSPDSAGRRTALALDTVEVRAKSGDGVLVVGPLHPLWLSQALGRFDALLTQRDLSATAKRLLVRSLSEAPVAPDQWPTGEDSTLQLSRPISGLIAYKSAADELEPKDVAETVARVVALFIESLPHARLGLRVAVLGGDAGPVVDGIAAAMDEHPEILKVAVHHRGAGQAGQSDKAERAITSGKLTLGSLPTTKEPLGGDLKPHLVFRLIPASAPGVALQPAAPVQAGLGASSGLLPTEFTVVESGLRARTPIDGARFPALSAFESVHALVSGSQPQGAFTRNAWAVSLRALLTSADVPSVSWDVVLAPRIGRRPPEHRFLLSHEHPTEQLSVAIVSRDIAPAARALKDAFKALGVEDLRPNVLNSLAVHLASVTSQGIMSPQRSGEQVLAASVLGMALRKELSGGEAFVAHLDGGSAATLLGQPPASLHGAFAIGFGADGDKLRVVLGYAALRDSVEADASRGQLTGPLQEVLARLSASVELATTVDGVGAVAAREALNWLLWPALAAAERPNSRTEQLLLQFERGVVCKLSAVAYLPPGSPALKRATGAKLGTHAIGLHALDVGTFEALVFGGGAVAKAR